MAIHYHPCPLVLGTFCYKCAVSIFNIIFFGLFSLVVLLLVSVFAILSCWIETSTITCWIYEFERAPTLSELNVGDKLLISVDTS